MSPAEGSGAADGAQPITPSVLWSPTLGLGLPRAVRVLDPHKDQRAGLGPCWKALLSSCHKVRLKSCGEMLPAGLGPRVLSRKVLVCDSPPAIRLPRPHSPPEHRAFPQPPRSDPGGQAPGCHPRASGSAHGSCCCFPGSPSQEAGFPVNSESRGLQRRLRGLPAGTCQGGCPPRVRREAPSLEGNPSHSPDGLSSWI